MNAYLKTAHFHNAYTLFKPTNSVLKTLITYLLNIQLFCSFYLWMMYIIIGLPFKLKFKLELDTLFIGNAIFFLKWQSWMIGINPSVNVIHIFINSEKKCIQFRNKNVFRVPRNWNNSIKTHSVTSTSNEFNIFYIERWMRAL